MGFIFRLYGYIIRLAILMAMAGTLKSATITMMGKAYESKKRGIISMASINYQLFGRKKYCASVHWPDKRCPGSE